MSCAFDFVPVHIFTCYLAPYNTKEVAETLSRLKGIVNSILERVKSSKIIIMGDFNQYRVDLTNYLQLKGIIPAIDEGTTTHRLGGHLDQIFSNLPLAEAAVDDRVGFTDHSSLLATFKF